MIQLTYARIGVKIRTLMLAGTVLAPGCYTTTIRSGQPPAAAAIQYDGKWHHGLVYGLAELSGPYSLKEICPNGWAEITTETSFVNGIAQAFTSNIYYPQSVTVRCVEAPAKRTEVPLSEAAETRMSEMDTDE